METGQLLRVFIALDIPDDIKVEISKLYARLKGYGFPIRWLDPAGLHITLVFLGERNVAFVNRVKTALAEVVQGVSVVGIRLAELGAFPNPRSPRVVWVGIKEGARELSLLASAINRALTPIGFEPEQRPFSPHLTIGRTKAPVTNIHRLLAEPFSSRHFVVKEALLMQSRLLPGGARYTPLAVFPLTAPSAPTNPPAQ